MSNTVLMRNLMKTSQEILQDTLPQSWRMKQIVSMSKQDLTIPYLRKWRLI